MGRKKCNAVPMVSITFITKRNTFLLVDNSEIFLYNYSKTIFIPIFLYIFIYTCTGKSELIADNLRILITHNIPVIVGNSSPSLI